MDYVYRVQLLGTSVSAARTLVSVFGTAAVAFEVLGIFVTNEDRETSEQWAVQLVELTADDGTNTAQTPVPIKNGGPAAVVSGNINYSVEPTSGDIMFRWGFNILNGLWVPFPDRELPRSQIGTAQGIGVELLSTPGAGTLVSAGMIVREIRL